MFPGSAATTNGGCIGGGGTRSFWTVEGITETLDFGPVSLVHSDVLQLSEVTVVVDNDFPLGSFAAELVSGLLGTTIDPGTTVDAWSVTSLRVDTASRRFGVFYLSFDTSLFSSTDYRPPPEPSQVDLVYFLVGEGPVLNFYVGSGRVDAGDDLDGDEVPDAGDNCPHTPNGDQTNSDAGPRGDACLCGDQNGDETVDVSDILAVNAAIFSPALVTALCDANADGACDIGDILGVNGEIFGPAESAVCAAQPCPDLQLSCP